MKAKEYINRIPLLLKKTWRRMREMIQRLTKRALWISGAVLVIIILAILFFAGVFSAGSSKQSNNSESATEIYDTSKDLFQPNTFTNNTITQKSTTGATVAITIPVTGISATDKAIASSATEFATTISRQSSTNETYTSKSFAYDDYLFITYDNASASSSATPFITIGYTKKGLLTKSLLGGDFKPTVVGFVADTIQSRYGTDRATAVGLTEEALSNRTYRLASNGLVIQVPSNKISTKIGPNYYEILIPNNIVDKYLK